MSVFFLVGGDLVGVTEYVGAARVELTLHAADDGGAGQCAHVTLERADRQGLRDDLFVLRARIGDVLLVPGGRPVVAEDPVDHRRGGGGASRPDHELDLAGFLACAAHLGVHSLLASSRASYSISPVLSSVT